MNAGPIRGTRVVVVPKFDPGQYLGLIQKHKATFLHIVPPIMVFLAKHPVVAKFDLTSVHTIVCGAAPLGDDIARQVKKRFPSVKSLRQGYGMTELSPVSHCSPFDNKKYGSAGVLVPNTECKIVDLESGKPAKRGERGEIWIRGPQVMKGYLNNAEATKRTIDADGFLHTGDVGYVDDEGFYYVVDRVKELIKYKGFQVPPAELEGLLLSHDGIADAAVIPKPDERGGEVPKAFVVLKPKVTLTEDEVKAFVKKNVAHYKQLRGGVVFVDKIHKSASGKILRRIYKAEELKKWEARSGGVGVLRSKFKDQKLSDMPLPQFVMRNINKSNANKPAYIDGPCESY